MYTIPVKGIVNENSIYHESHLLHAIVKYETHNFATVRILSTDLTGSLENSWQRLSCAEFD